MTATDPRTRLALSRMRLQLTLQQWQSGQKAAAASSSPDWLNALRAEPGTRVLMDVVGLWWQQQPWHQTAATLAALVLLKPWRWLQAANKPGP